MRPITLHQLLYTLTLAPRPVEKTAVLSSGSCLAPPLFICENTETDETQANKHDDRKQTRKNAYFGCRQPPSCIQSVEEMVNENPSGSDACFNSKWRQFPTLHAVGPSPNDPTNCVPSDLQTL